MNFSQIKGTVTGNYGDLPNPDNREVAYRAAAEGIVLLKNDGMLPLAPGSVALFGAGAEGTVYCGTGSGYVFTSHPVTVKEGLTSAGFTISTDRWLKKCRENERKTNKKDKTLSLLDRKWSGLSIMAEEPLIGEIDLTEDKTAVYVLRRSCGETADRKPVRGDYYLSEREEMNLKKLADHYHSVILVLNTCVMDLSFVKSMPEIKAILYMGLSGMEGGNAVADIIAGKINPSGKLTDTFAERYEDYPTAGHFADQDNSALRPVYREGIYVGYRYFDSFKVKPLYPFGYGLSYTNFKLETVNVEADWKSITVTVRVENTGTLSGKETVQLYVSSPQGKLHKPYKELKAFEKTECLKPGQDALVKLNIKTTDLSSFCESQSSWIMEAGNYIIRVGNSSVYTTAVATLTLDETVMTKKVNDVLHPEDDIDEIKPETFVNHKAEGVILHLKAKDCVTEDVRNDMDDYLITYIPEGKDYHSLVNENKFKPQFFRKEEVKYVKNCPDSTLLDVKNGDVTMEEFVAGLPPEVLVRICTGTLEETEHKVPDRLRVKLSKLDAPTSSGATTAQYEKSLGIPSALLFDGPGGMHIIGCSATAFPVGMVLAQSWNVSLMEEVGRAMAKDMESFHVSIVLAPGMNIHRDPLGGRNFEYYSEDPFISGQCAAAFTKGVQHDGKRGVAIKHFLGNNQEAERLDGDNQMSVRALRELYLKGFEIAVKEGHPMTVMTSYNKVNGLHTSSNRDLLTSILRNEWGFDGFIMTDWGTNSDKVFDLQAGNDLIMGGYSAEKLISALSFTVPEFNIDGSVNKTIISRHMGMVKSEIDHWGSFVCDRNGTDFQKTVIPAGTIIADEVLKAIHDGVAEAQQDANGQTTVVYRGTDRGTYLALGTLQECTIRILNVLKNSSAMDDLIKRTKYL